VYFSTDDGLSETRTVFLGGCALPDAWAGRESFTVAELGFGTGLNIVALLDLWRREGPPGARLNVFTVEGYPLSREEAARALASWPEVAGPAEALLAAWPSATPGFHRIDLPDFRAVIDLAVGDAAWALEQWSGQADAWFLDGFSPALNPSMWSDAVLDGIAARSAAGARLATFTVAGAVRRGLSDRGFAVEKRPGHVRKRERLEARLPAVRAVRPPPTVAIIGAGIAGAAVARALVRAGSRVTVVETGTPGDGASGFPAALVTPRLDAGNEMIAGFNAQALERAARLYDATDGAVLSRGVVRLEHGVRDAGRFAKVAAQAIWPANAMTPLTEADVSARLGQSAAGGGLMMRDALTVSPREVLAAWLAGCRTVTGHVAAISQTGGTRRLLDGDGRELAEADVVVIAAGWGTTGLAPHLNLSPVRGQAEWVTGVGSPPAVAWGGYVAPTPDGFLFGATHQRGETGTDLRPADTEQNLGQLEAALRGVGAAARAAPVRRCRAAVRATTPDRQPLCGRLEDGVYVLGGLGSRGFCHAPLLGEHLAAEICGLPSPLPADFAARLAPLRSK
jgi:tRNA 5-methylaminomethyl-2-thiouridine biosynthesis bifunctional protein